MQAQTSHDHRRCRSALSSFSVVFIHRLRGRCHRLGRCRRRQGRRQRRRQRRRRHRRHCHRQRNRRGRPRSAQNLFPVGPEEPGKDEWQRRAKKRQEGAAAVKKRTKKDNLNATELFEGGGGYPARPRPRTPDPTDSTVSNREWEKGVQQWRPKGLKWFAAGASQTRHPGPRKGAAARAQVDVHSPRAADLGGESEHVAGSEDEPVRAELS